MANPYYSFNNEFVPGSLARSDAVNSEFRAAQDGFELLPSDPRDLHSGGAVFVGELTVDAPNAYACRTKNTRTGLVSGDTIVCVVPEGGTNTNGCTLSVDSSIALPWVRHDGTPMEADDLMPGLIYEARYTEGGDEGGGVSARWQLMQMPVTIVQTTLGYQQAALASATTAATEAAASAVSAAEAAASAADAAASEFVATGGYFGDDDTLGLANGGTGGTDAATARAGLGLGSAATHDVGITIGSIPRVGSNGLLDTSIIPAQGSISLDDIPVVTVAKGGTGATDASTARTNLGLGSAATRTAGSAANNVALLSASALLPVSTLPGHSTDLLTSGTIADARLPTLSVAKGGTGATTAAGARTNIGLGSAATVDMGDASGEIPALQAGGVFDPDRIPDLPATKIASGTIADARIPDLDATKTTSGTFDIARIPNFSAAKVTSGTFAAARLATNPSAGQALYATATGTEWKDVSVSVISSIQRGTATTNALVTDVTLSVSVDVAKTMVNPLGTTSDARIRMRLIDSTTLRVESHAAEPGTVSYEVIEFV